MSDPTGSIAMTARMNAGSRRGGEEISEAIPPTPLERNAQMTARERREFEKRHEGMYGPGTLVGQSGRVYNIIGNREEGLSTGIHNRALTQERFEGMQRAAAGPAKPRQPAERTTRRRGQGGGGGSTTLLTADGLDSSRAGQRRTVLGA